MSFLIAGDKFQIGVPAVTPKIPEGWMLRVSQFDYAAAISPEHVEWLIATDGTLHEVRQMEQSKNIWRKLTGKTLTVVEPFGSGVVEQALEGRPVLA